MADGYTLTFNHSLSAFHVSLIIVNRIPIIIFSIRICPLFGKINITKDDVIRILTVFISRSCNIGIATFGCIIGKDVSFILVNRYTFRICIISKITFVTITCKSVYIITFWLSYFLTFCRNHINRITVFYSFICFKVCCFGITGSTFCCSYCHIG